MNSFQWSKPYLTGILNVDEQHKKLVDLINELGNELSQDSLSESTLNSILNSLADYAKYHFDDEEKLMLEKGIDERHFKKHKELHSKFIDFAGHLFEKASAENHAQMESILDYLIHWLVYHILGTDKMMAQQLDKIDEGISSAEAYEEEELNYSNSTEPLLAALNGLFHQLQDRNRELIELNQSLEGTVKERTKELSDANKRLESITVTDALTSLHNRRYAMQIMDKLWNENGGKDDLSCIMIDADHFKEVNDTYGHDAGDKVLCELSRTLERSIRSDDFICRLGGDEFLIICPNTDLSGAETVAKKVYDFVNKLSVDVAGGSWDGSVSVGVATRNKTVESISELIKLADKSVYIAKKDGKNCVRITQLA